MRKLIEAVSEYEPGVSPPVVAMDGVLDRTVCHAVRNVQGRILGITTVDGLEEAFHMAGIDDTIDVADYRKAGFCHVELVVVGPTAMLGDQLGDLVDRLREMLPLTPILCLTGMRTDLSFEPTLPANG